jgi:hypothetical protein
MKAEIERLRGELADCDAESDVVPWMTNRLAEAVGSTLGKSVPEQFEYALAKAVEMKAEIERLTRERDELEADAARYQFLRARFVPGAIVMNGLPKWEWTSLCWLYGETVDEAVDRLMEQENEHVRESQASNGEERTVRAGRTDDQAAGCGDPGGVD